MDKKNGRHGAGRRAMAGFLAAILVLAVLCGALMSRRSETATVKVRYDGQTYAGDGGRTQPSGGSGSHYNGFGGITADKATMGALESAAFAPSDAYGDAEYDMAPAAPAEAGNGYDNGGGNTATAHGKKLAWTYEYTAETDGYDACIAALSAWLDGNGGYVESTDTDKRDWDTLDGKSSNTVRRTYLELRVPSEYAAGMRGALSGFGCEVTRENARMSDRTQAYADAGLQKAAYEAEYETLLALLPLAENVSETIQIQDRLASLNYMIQSYGKQMELIDADVDYSRVSLTLYEVKYYEATIQKFRLKMGERMADAFEDFIYYLPEFLFVLVYIGAAGLLVVALASLFMRRVIRMRGKAGPQVIEVRDRRDPPEKHDGPDGNKNVQT